MHRSRTIFLAAVLLLAAPAAAQVCGDGAWPDGEFCGQDAYAITGETDMNHDCVVDFLDFKLIIDQMGMTGPGLSGDINMDNTVNLTDIGFFSMSHTSGNPVTPCNPSPGYPDHCDGTLSLSLDQNVIVSRGRYPDPPIFDVYLIVDGWVDGGSLEFGLEHSSNLILASVTPVAGSALNYYGSNPAGTTGRARSRRDGPS